MQCSQFLQYISEKCKECFKNHKNDKRDTDLEESLVQLKVINPDKPALLPPPPLNKQISIFTPIEDDSQQHLIFSPIRRKKQITFPNQEQESEEEFHSIQSEVKLSPQSPLKQIQQFSQPDKLQKPNSFGQRRDLSQSCNSSDWQESLTTDTINVRDQIQKFKQWTKKQYGKVQHANFRVSQAVKLRLQRQTMITHLLHKLQDFCVGYLQDSIKNTAFHFTNKSKTLQVKYVKDEIGSSNFKRAKIMSYYILQLTAHNPSHILTAFSSKEFMANIHDFSVQRAIQYQGDQLATPLPILQVHLQDRHLKDERTYHIATQISEYKQQSKQLVEVNFSLDEGEDSWQRVIKIVLNYTSLIEIYSQSYEEILLNEERHFQQKFKWMQKYLTDLKLIPNK